MFVHQTMKTDIITVPPETRLTDAGKIMIEKSVRHLPVTERNGVLAGIVTDRDMRDAMPSSLQSGEEYERGMRKVAEHAVSDIMTKDILTVSMHYTLQDALILLREKKVGALPVIDEEGKLTGILSTRDLLAAFVDIMGIGEPGTLLCLLTPDKPGQLKKIVDIAAGENISLGSILVARHWEKNTKAVFPYVLTNNVVGIKKKLKDAGIKTLKATGIS